MIDYAKIGKALADILNILNELPEQEAKAVERMFGAMCSGETANPVGILYATVFQPHQPLEESPKIRTLEISVYSAPPFATY